MKSLKSLSLKEITKDAKNLPQLIKILKKYPHVETDLQFWEDSLRNLIYDHYLNELLVLRGDLRDGSDWFVLCQDMIRGNAYIYTWYTGPENEHFLRPMFTKGAYENYEPEEISIRGTLPLAGTHSVCGMLWTRHNKDAMSFCAFGISHRDALERAVRWTLTLLLGTSDDDRYLFSSLDEYISIKADTIDDLMTFFTDILEEMENPRLEFTYSNHRWKYTAQDRQCGMTFSTPLLFPNYDNENNVTDMSTDPYVYAAASESNSDW
jgi:hypothetical protein